MTDGNFNLVFIRIGFKNGSSLLDQRLSRDLDQIGFFMVTTAFIWVRIKWLFVTFCSWYITIYAGRIATVGKKLKIFLREGIYIFSLTDVMNFSTALLMAGAEDW
jgi:hypothetical protein